MLGWEARPESRVWAKGLKLGLFPKSGANSDICLLSLAVGNVGRWGLPPWKQQHLSQSPPTSCSALAVCL